MSKLDSLSHPSHLEKVGLFEQWAPGPLQAFRNLAEQCFADGALSTQDKELIAVGCAHVLRCPYCIDHHIDLAQQAGAGKLALAEAIWVGIAMAAGACYAHASVAMQTMAGEKGDYYAPDATDRLQALAAMAPAAYGAFAELNHAAFKAGELSAGFKELIAVACAHNTQCPFCIDAHVRAALEADRSQAEVAEAVWVAIEMSAGACVGHAGLAAAILGNS